jgi:flagellar basal body P-ring formation protein FlgA
MKPIIAVVALLATPAMSEIVVPTRTIPAQQIIGPEDLTLRDLIVPGAVRDMGLIVGMEARVALYSGRPIRESDVGFPAIVDRNQRVALIYQQGTIHISTEGRALDRAGPGDVIRVMNVGSRATVMARIGADGAAYVSQ